MRHDARDALHGDAVVERQLQTWSRSPRGVTVYHVSGPIAVIDHIQVNSGEPRRRRVAVFDGSPANVTLWAGTGSELLVLGKILGPPR